MTKHTSVIDIGENGKDTKMMIVTETIMAKNPAMSFSLISVLTLLASSQRSFSKIWGAFFHEFFSKWMIFYTVVYGCWNVAKLKIFICFLICYIKFYFDYIFDIHVTCFIAYLLYFCMHIICLLVLLYVSIFILFDFKFVW